jgi:hypothetical protein
MEPDSKTPVDRDDPLESFAAELTITAYRVALRTGTRGSWLEMQLVLWRALTDTVQTWVNEKCLGTVRPRPRQPCVMAPPSAAVVPRIHPPSVLHHPLFPRRRARPPPRTPAVPTGRTAGRAAAWCAPAWRKVGLRHIMLLGLAVRSLAPCRPQSDDSQDAEDQHDGKDQEEAGVHLGLGCRIEHAQHPRLHLNGLLGPFRLGREKPKPRGHPTSCPGKKVFAAFGESAPQYSSPLREKCRNLRPIEAADLALIELCQIRSP